MIPILYTPKEVAKQLKVSRRSVYHWVNAGKLKALKVGQGLRITDAQLQDFVTENMSGQAAKAPDSESSRP